MIVARSQLLHLLLRHPFTVSGENLELKLSIEVSCDSFIPPQPIHSYLKHDWQKDVWSELKHSLTNNVLCNPRGG